MSRIISTPKIIKCINIAIFSYSMVQIEIADERKRVEVQRAFIYYQLQIKEQIKGQVQQIVTLLISMTDIWDRAFAV